MNAATAFSQGSSLGHLTDTELLRATRSLVGRSNQLLAALLAHLAEVEPRGVHRTRACASLYTYCIYELRFSEDEAYRRVTAARLVRRFPALLEAIATGELHLTGVVMLGPHLTEANLTEVLARAKHRTKKEERVRELLPSRVSEGNRRWVTRTALPLSPVRNLLPGDRPRDWMSLDPFAEEPALNAASAGSGRTTRGSRAAGGTDVPRAAALSRTVDPKSLRWVVGPRVPNESGPLCCSGSTKHREWMSVRFREEELRSYTPMDDGD